MKIHVSTLCTLSLLFAHTAYTTVNVIGTEQQYQDAVMNNANPVVVVFSATWCPACQTVKGPFEELSNEAELASISFASVDVDTLPALAKENVAQGVPTFVLIDRGVKKNSFAGALPKDSLRATIKDTLLSGTQHDDMQQPESTALPAQPRSEPVGILSSITGFIAMIFCKIKAILSGILAKIAGIFGR